MNPVLALVPIVKPLDQVISKGALNKRGDSRALLGEWTTLFFPPPGNFWPAATVNAGLRLLSLQFGDIGSASVQLFQISDTLCPWLWTKQDRVWSKTMAGDSSLMKATKGARDRARLNMKTQPGTEPVVVILFIKETVRSREHHTGSWDCKAYLLRDISS